MVGKYIVLTLALSGALTNAITTGGLARSEPEIPKVPHRNCTAKEIETFKNDTKNLQKCIWNILVNTFLHVKTDSYESSVLCKNVSDLQNKYVEPVSKSSACFIKDQQTFSLTMKTLIAMVNSTINKSSEFKSSHVECIKDSREQVINTIRNIVDASDQQMKYLESNVFDVSLILGVNVDNAHSIDTAAILKYKVNQIFEANQKCLHLSDLTNELFDTASKILKQEIKKSVSGAGDHTHFPSIVVLSLATMFLM